MISIKETRTKQLDYTIKIFLKKRKKSIVRQSLQRIIKRKMENSKKTSID
jgi:hypothetical protein